MTTVRDERARSLPSLSLDIVAVHGDKTRKVHATIPPLPGHASFAAVVGGGESKGVKGVGGENAVWAAAAFRHASPSLAGWCSFSQLPQCVGCKVIWRRSAGLYILPCS